MDKDGLLCPLGLNTAETLGRVLGHKLKQQPANIAIEREMERERENDNDNVLQNSSHLPNLMGVPILKCVYLCTFIFVLHTTYRGANTQT